MNNIAEQQQCGSDGEMSDRVTILRRGALGDFILTLPLIQAFCRQGRNVRVISRSAYRDLLPPDCPVRGFMDIEGQQIAALFAETVPLGKQLAAALAGADAVVFLARDAVLERRLRDCGVRNVFWIDPRPASPPHAAVRFLHAAGLPIPTDLLDRPLWSETPAGDELWIHPGSGSPRRKNVPLEMFAEFAECWYHRHGGTRSVRVSFGEADQELIRPFHEIFARRAMSVLAINMPSLAELKASMQAHAGTYVGVDSGVSHLAGALGIRSTIFFRGTDPRVWRPLGPCHIVELA